MHPAAITHENPPLCTLKLTQRDVPCPTEPIQVGHDGFWCYTTLIKDENSHHKLKSRSEMNETTRRRPNTLPRWPFDDRAWSQVSLLFKAREQSNLPQHDHNHNTSQISHAVRPTKGKCARSKVSGISKAHEIKRNANRKQGILGFEASVREQEDNKDYGKCQKVRQTGLDMRRQPFAAGRRRQNPAHRVIEDVLAGRRIQALDRMASWELEPATVEIKAFVPFEAVSVNVVRHGEA
ncbi:hypothetical protein DFP72DRAFT_1068026 [Ephemerocybe angulata]|uniref:Uncharacterized protein n=1 Tax=Ephemerocybe angulata TaxID=980116 RepID=A0A8H6HZZ7_9AGAR|nr:hypothetical protein DFP72DRAFT_1068026 [Tulosesus angulatus]